MFSLTKGSLFFIFLTDSSERLFNTNNDSLLFVQVAEASRVPSLTSLERSVGTSLPPPDGGG